MNIPVQLHDGARIRRHLLAGGAIGALICGCYATTVEAQTAGANSVQEIVVTAQKREQRLQDVPVAVTVLNTQQLQQAGVRSVKDLTNLASGLNATTNGSEATTTVRIRGIGTVADNAGLEDAVGLYIDGVYRPRNGVGFNNLGELADVEVLKGPQGTLFGKNTVSGVVQVSTQRPSFTFGGQAEVTLQNYNGYGVSLSATGPLLGDVLAGRIFFADNERDGYLPVVQSPSTHIPDQNDEHMHTFRGQLLYVPNSKVDVNFIADYTERNDHCCVAVNFLNGAPAALQSEIFPGSLPNPVSPTNMTAYLNDSDVEHIREGGLSAQVNWTTPWLNNAKFTSITAYRDWRDVSGADADATLADLLVEPPTDLQEFQQFSEELRYSGEAGPLSWQVGAFFGHEKLDVDIPLNYGADLGTYLAVLTGGNGPLASGTYNPPGGAYPTGEGSNDHYRQEENSESIYTQDDFRVTDKLTLTGGIRFTAEHKSLLSLFNNNDTSGTCQHFEAIAAGLGLALTKANLGTDCFVVPGFKGLTTHQSLDENAVTGTFKATYKFSDTMMAYASYSRGNLVGGFNLAEVTTAVGSNPNASLTPDPNTAFPAEGVDSYEVGSKLQFFNRRLLISGAIFYQDYTNFQLNAFTGTQYIETTIPEAISVGAELEAYYRVTPDLTVNAGITNADTYYPNSQENQAALGNNTVGSASYQATPLFRLPGSRLSYAPLWSLVAGVNYDHPVFSGYKVTFSSDAKYQSEYSTGSDHDPVKRQDGFAIFNGRVGFGTADGRWIVEAWATNLFDKQYKQTSYDAVFQTFSAPQPTSNSGLNNYAYFPGQPRFYGLTLRVKY
jgi:iron complex outermembrane receptor protein